LAKKYTVSEAALRKLIKQMVTEEVEKKWSQPDGPFIDEFHEDPWFYLGEPTPAGDKKNTSSKQQAPYDLSEWQNPFYPEFDELDTPPFLNKQPKKK
jgi:hypothetical protein